MIKRMAAGFCGWMESLCWVQARKLASDLEYAHDSAAPLHVVHHLSYELDAEVAAGERWALRRVMLGGSR